MDKIKITIDGKELTVNSDSTVLSAAEEAGILIPRLCFLKGIHEQASCRVCVVKIEGQRGLKNSCTFKVYDGMKVDTKDPDIKRSVKYNLQLLAANHTFECWACPREHNCEFLDLLRDFNVSDEMGEDPKFIRKPRVYNKDNVAMMIDTGKCLLCGRCVSACTVQAGTHILDFNGRGNVTLVGPADNHPLSDSGCIYCGKCIQACPVGAIKEMDDTDKVEDALNDPRKHVVVQIAPATRAALGEEFGLPIGTNVEGKLYSALNELGFDDITDTTFAADLTIMEEGTEFIKRVQNNGKLPMFTSCSPGWIRWIEQYKPEYLENLSSCKSPQQMQGAAIKHYFADKIGVDKEDVVVVSVMPCVAKKFEASRPEMEFEGVRDVDIVLTTRELARLIKRNHVDFLNLEDHAPVGQLSSYTGAGIIFGATGGVMEAALRTVAEILENKELNNIEFHDVRGVKDIKEAELNIAGIDVNVAVVHGGAAIADFFKLMEKGNKQYHFVEFMGCTGGCVNGGGQPIVKASVQDRIDVRAERAKALYTIDKEVPLRKSHENQAVMLAYKEFFGEPNSELAHEMLHTTYKKRDYFSK